MVEWKWALFSELSNTALYDICALRQAVFALEQHCFYPDLDYRDQQAMHLMGVENDKLVAYLRLLPLGLPYPAARSFGRVLTAKAVRGQGVGKALIQQVLTYLEKIHNTAPLIISAQLYLEKFYQSFGFESQSQPYDEDGIPHVKMILHAKT